MCAIAFFFAQQPTIVRVNPFGLPDQALGAIVAAIIAGVVAWLGLIISKESKVSEFRQQWIDGLRAEIATVIRHGQSLGIFTLLGKEAGNPGYKADQDYSGLSEAIASIRLRLNPKEAESMRLLTAQNKYLSAVDTLVRGDGCEVANSKRVVSSCADDLVAAAQVVLKQEWLRVRSGEMIYRVAKWAALLLIAAAFVALLRHWLK